MFRRVVREGRIEESRGSESSDAQGLELGKRVGEVVEEFPFKSSRWVLKDGRRDGANTRSEGGGRRGVGRDEVLKRDQSWGEEREEFGSESKGLVETCLMKESRLETRMKEDASKLKGIQVSAVIYRQRKSKNE